MLNNFEKKFSVIIPTIKENKYLFKNLDYLNNQTFKNFEVILISENNLEINFKEFDFEIVLLKEQIFTPGEKRNFAAKNSSGEFLAFIDDDAYPDKNWLFVANEKIKKMEMRNFILGGPGVLPKDDSLISKIIDISFRSFLYGNARLRYESKDRKNIYLDDWPSVNMIIEKNFFLNLKGFDKNFWPGEDSKLCNKLIINGGKIIYIHNMIVNHYRRSNFTKHIKQIFRYSFTRGKLFKANDKNSRKIIYFLPSIYFVYLFFTIVMNNSLFFIPILGIFLLLWFEIFFLIKEKKLILKLVFPIVVNLNIIIYGIGFAFSYVLPNYKTKLGR